MAVGVDIVQGKRKFAIHQAFQIVVVCISTLDDQNMPHSRLPGLIHLMAALLFLLSAAANALEVGMPAPPKSKPAKS